MERMVNVRQFAAQSVPFDKLVLSLSKGPGQAFLNPL